MRIRQAGRIDDGLWLLGTQESCVYLLEGTKTSVLISAGMPYILPDLFRQMASRGMTPEKIEQIVILHAHFDHVGVVPYLKRNRPDMKIYASARGWEVLTNPRAVSVINEFSEKVRRRMKGSEDSLAGLDWAWRDDVKGETLAQGDRLDLGGRQLQFFETPGHSSCSISAWVPGLNILFPSDAVAIPYRDEWIIAVWQNRPHDGLRDPVTPGKALSPNEKYTALVEVAGYVPVPLDADDYIELLPVQWRTINSYGVRINHRTYDAKALNPYRRQHSGVDARNGQWEVHYDPYDVSRIWVRNHHEDGWLAATWTHLRSAPVPFGETLWRHARAVADGRGTQKAQEAERVEIAEPMRGEPSLLKLYPMPDFVRNAS